MGEMEGADRIELSLPASRDLMLVARLAASGVVARAGLTLDVLEDVKMAVEEACLCVMAQEAAPERLLLEFFLASHSIAVRVSRQGELSQAAGVPEGELDVMRCILESLVDSVQMEQGADGLRSILLKAASPV